MATVLEPTLAPAITPKSSDRSFGFVFAVVFAIVGALPLIRGGTPRLWAFGIAAVLALIAVTAPQILRPLNDAWRLIGQLLHRVISPVVMSAIFFLCVTPIGLIMRWRGKDVLALKQRPDLTSYWVTRESPSPNAESMRRQF
jgi:Saxitoxin biosynthesis operon protein SxtJ